MDVDKNLPPSIEEINNFVSKVDFLLPDGYLNFLKDSNGAELSFKNNHLFLWPLTDLFDLNYEYGVVDFAPDFFIIGSNGGNTAYAVHKSTGDLYEMPFIGMSNKEGVFISHDFVGLLKNLNNE